MKKFWLLILINLLLLAAALVIVIPAYGQGETKLVELKNVESVKECGMFVHIILTNSGNPNPLTVVFDEGDGNMTSVDPRVDESGIAHYTVHRDGREISGAYTRVPMDWDGDFTVACSPPPPPERDDTPFVIALLLMIFFVGAAFGRAVESGSNS